MTDHPRTVRSDAEAHQLLRAFFAGQPVEELGELLRSGDEATVKAGAWIASELGSRASPIMDDLAPLVSHPSKYVRFFVIDSILAAATAEHGRAIAGAVQLICDVESAVRWKAMNFLARAAPEQLLASLPYIEDLVVRARTQWLSHCDRVMVPAEVTAQLDSSDRLRRLFAGIAAVRLAARDRSALDHAADSGDPEISSFAKEQIEALEDGRRYPYT